MKANERALTAERRMRLFGLTATNILRSSRISYLRAARQPITRQAAAACRSPARSLDGVASAVRASLGLAITSAMSMDSPQAKRARLDNGSGMQAAAVSTAAEPDVTNDEHMQDTAGVNGAVGASATASAPARRRRRRAPSSSDRWSALPATADANSGSPASGSPAARRPAAAATADPAEGPHAVAVLVAAADAGSQPSSTDGMAAQMDAAGTASAAGTPSQNGDQNNYKQQQRLEQSQQQLGTDQQQQHQQPPYQQQQQQQCRPRPPQQQQQSGRVQQQQQQQQQQSASRQKGKAKKRQRPGQEYLIGIHQCIKRDLPHEAVHLYCKLKKVDPDMSMEEGTCSALLNLCLGKWQWELHQRHQHLLREYTAAGRDAAPLAEAAAKVVAAALHQKEQQQATAAGSTLGRMALDTGGLEGLPPQMVCHVEKHVELLLAEKLKDEAWLNSLVGDMPPKGQQQQSSSLLALLDCVVSLVLGDWKAAGKQLDEQLYLQLARVAGIQGDPDKAFDYAKQLVATWKQGGPKAAKLVPRLRDFQPALVGYALTGQAHKAQEVVDMMLEVCSQDLTEAEFALWLEAIANGGSYEQLSKALQLLSGELNELRNPTLSLVEQFFRSERAAAALAAGGPLASLGKLTWQQVWVMPSEDGFIQEAGARLQLTDLSGEDWDAFAQQVRSLAEQQEKHTGKFAGFCSWLDRKGPYNVMIDGANVALWGENYDGGIFRPEKIKVAYDAVREQHADAKILLVLHAGRHHSIRQHNPELFDWLEGLQKQGGYYVTPGGSNDDWYWMYATVHARENGLLMSNDLLRDHVWNLLRPKHMLKWTQRHIVRYSFNYEKTEIRLQHPLPYTPCVQQLVDDVWLLPSADREGQWLCCKPV